MPVSGEKNKKGMVEWVAWIQKQVGNGAKSVFKLIDKKWTL